VEGLGASCNEVGIYEANSRAAQFTPHPCNVQGLYKCFGDECGEFGVCDKNGCPWNQYSLGSSSYYGRGPEFQVDTTRPFRVVTQFPTDCDPLQIRRLYVQDGRIIPAKAVRKKGLPAVNYLDNTLCSAQGARAFMELGAMERTYEALARGMVLAMSIWWDEVGNMTWLDGGHAGPCGDMEGSPQVIRMVEPNPEVTFRNIRWGEIDSTYGSEI
jgi:cellulase